jgi:hypothetical protein
MFSGLGLKADARRLSVHALAAFDTGFIGAKRSHSGHTYFATRCSDALSAVVIPFRPMFEQRTLGTPLWTPPDRSGVFCASGCALVIVTALTLTFW